MADIADKFEQELVWCIEQLQLGLETQNPNSKQAIEATKAMKILLSSKAPMIKKRQVMRNTFGDYRKKMADMERKSSAVARKAIIAPAVTKTMQKSTFFRKSVTRNVNPGQGVPNESQGLNNEKLSACDENAVTQSSESENSVTQSSNGTDCGDLSSTFQFNFKIEDQSVLENVETKSEAPEDKTEQVDDGITQANVFPLKTDNSFRFNFALPT